MCVDEDWCGLWVISVYDSDQILKLSSDALSTCSRHTCSKINPPSPFFLLTFPSHPLWFWISNPFFVYCFLACLSHINRCNQVWIANVLRPPTACRLKSLIVLCWICLMKFDKLSRMPFFFFTTDLSFRSHTKEILFCKICSLSQCTDQKQFLGK